MSRQLVVISEMIIIIVSVIGLSRVLYQPEGSNLPISTDFYLKKILDFAIRTKSLPWAER